MDKNVMLDTLAQGFLETMRNWEAALEQLNAALDSLYARRAQLRDLKADQELMTAHAILGETHKEGMINGSNEQTRKLQATVLVAALQENDPDWMRLTENIRLVEAAIEDAELRKEKLTAQLSFLRNQARMIAGLANALAG